MSMTGERSAQMFLHYTHVIEDAQEDVAKAMQAAFA